MGLDMNLYRRRYVKNWDFELEKHPENKYDLELYRGGKKIELKKPVYILEELGYWRKANQIHNWFVENCNSGVDNNGTFMVGRESLEELLETVIKVLDSVKLVKGKVHNGDTLKDGKWIPNMEDGETVEDPGLAAELLPTTSGFFFGSEEYDQWYVSQLKDTKEILEAALEDPDADEFEYDCSW